MLGTARCAIPTSHIVRTHDSARALWAKHVFYIDRGVIALNKPPGLVCQGSGRPDVQNPFDEMLSDLKAEFGLSATPLPVHRLDKGTTGTLLLAPSLTAARELSRQFQTRTISKSYLALVQGYIPADCSVGQISTPLVRHEGRVSISETGQEAQTDYTVLARSPIAPLSLVRLNILHGRKHQIRVHLAQVLRTPILGDPVYSDFKAESQTAPLLQNLHANLFLHSSRISLFRYRNEGPRKRFCLSLTAPLPTHFVDLCQKAEIPLEIDCINGSLHINGEHATTAEIEQVGGRLLL